MPTIEMGFNEPDVEILGNGVIRFRNALKGDWDTVYDYIDEMVKRERSAMYEPTTDPETGEPAYINRSGYLFSQESIDSMPHRGSAIHQDKRDEVHQLFDTFEDARDACLLRYFEKYPLAYNCVWWKVKGHIVAYGPGVYLGSHSDISAEYVYGIHQTRNELALRNVVSCLIYLNDSVDSEDELNGRNFTGGDFHFDYLDVSFKPKAGDIVMFPSNYMAAHQVLPVGKGQRISYLGWYSQGTPNPAVHEDVTDPLQQPEVARISTNVWLPTLREDYRNFLTERGYDKSSPQYRVTNLNTG